MKYKNGSIIVEAVKLEDNDESIEKAVRFLHGELMPFDVDKDADYVRNNGGIFVLKKDGSKDITFATFGDYIVKDPLIGYHVCEPMLFENTHIPIEEVDDESNETHEEITGETPKILTIWLPSGRAMKFEDVRDFYEESIRYGENIIRFNYMGVSTGVRRNAVLKTDELLGWALEQERSADEL